MKKIKILLLCVLSCVSICTTGCDKGESSGVVSEYYTLQLPSESGVYDWVRGYAACDFDACDNNASSYGFQFSDFYSSVPHTSSLAADSIYLEMLNKSVSSVQNVSVDNTDTEDEFKVTITYKPYQSVTSVSLDKEKLESILDDYVINDCSLEDYRAELSDYILSEFDKCFTMSDEESTLEVVLKQGTEGELTVVLNAEDFIVPLLDNQGITEVLDVFEEGIYVELQGYLDSYRV